MQNSFFGTTASQLTSKLQKLCFRAILRQDSESPSSYWYHRQGTDTVRIVEYFDEDEHSV